MSGTKARAACACLRSPQVNSPVLRTPFSQTRQGTPVGLSVWQLFPPRWACVVKKNHCGAKCSGGKPVILALKKLKHKDQELQADWATRDPASKQNRKTETSNE